MSEAIKPRTVVGWRARMEQQIKEQQARVSRLTQCRLSHEEQAALKKRYLDDPAGYAKALGKARAAKSMQFAKDELKRLKVEAARIALLESEDEAEKKERARLKKNAYARKWRAMPGNKEKLSAWAKVYRSTPEYKAKKRAYGKIWRAKHKASVAASRKKRYEKEKADEAYKARTRARMRAYRAKPEVHERQLANRKAWGKRNRAYAIQYFRQYRIDKKAASQRGAEMSGR